MAFWNIANTPVTVIPAGSLAQADYIFQNTGSNTIYISDQQNVTADATSLAIAAGTPFTWSKSDSLYAVCSAGNPSTLFGTANGAQVGTSIAALLTPTAQYVIAAAANTLYRSTYTLTNGIYTIATTPNTVVVNIDFYDVNGALITSVTSTSGSNLTVNLATTAVQFDYWTTSGTNTSISITKSGSNIPYASGTLYTYTATGTVTQKGDGYFILVAGGGSGGQSASNGLTPGGGGGSGGISGGRVLLTGSMPVTIGLGGVGVSTAATNGNPGGSSTFNGVTCTGGGGGLNSSSGGGTAGTPNGGGGGNGAFAVATGGGSSASSTTIFPFLTMGTTGGGGGASTTNTPGIGAGSGIGTGGTGGQGGAGQPGSGFGSGGGGATLLGGTVFSGAGASGVLYIII